MDDVRVLVPQSQRMHVKETRDVGRIAAVRSSRLYPEQLGQLRSRLVIACRSSLLDELARSGVSIALRRFGQCGRPAFMHPGRLLGLDPRRRYTAIKPPGAKLAAMSYVVVGDVAARSEHARDFTRSSPVRRRPAHGDRVHHAHTSHKGGTQ